MKKSPFSKPNGAARVADPASPVGSNRLSDRPDWDELLRSLSPSSPSSWDPSSDPGQPRSQQSPPARPPTAADGQRRDKAQQSRTAAAPHSRGQLAVLLPEEATLYAGDTPFVRQTPSGSHWLAVIPLGQPSDREHAALADRAMCDAIAGGTEAAARALVFRSETAQHCTADVQQRLMGKMQQIVEGDLSPQFPAEADKPAFGVEKCPSGNAGGGLPGDAGGTAFWEASASLTLAVFMADLVAQVEGHCVERGWALARLWNAHVAITAQTSRAQREALQQLQAAHATQEAQLLSARAEAAAVQRLRKQLANQSQAADGLRAELRAATNECNALRQQLVQVQSDGVTTDTPAATEQKPAVFLGDAVDVEAVQN